MLKYIKGNLFDRLDYNNIIIPHVVNIHGAWGAGFVLAINKYLGLEHQKSYQKHVLNFLHKKQNVQKNSKLGGTVLFTSYFTPSINSNQSIEVANMFAQTLGGEKPLNYEWLYRCLEQVSEVALEREAIIYAPKFGSGLAGGEWSIIEAMIQHVWKDLDVTIFEL